MPNDDKKTQEEIQAMIKDLKAAVFDEAEYIGQMQEAANQAQARINKWREQIANLTRQLSEPVVK